ncbi:glycosyltransferase family 8 protein [Lophiostoma macrostomum CBS 122681]|uniref:Glycosyltransferase family 8 protein n=1 Tax=Lophiostoma macrostomum CBS 122681 TaxID=1314788 RepID=A0A6A6TN46_9PLEO|nr:glycosyltransferase family 8 protein [Lophiostoma macrostomum CBS 122681]
MRRKRSDELPRYVNEPDAPPFQWRRRYLYYIVFAYLFIYWLRAPKRTTSDSDSVNWSSYAYSLYATDSATLCHAVLVFDALARLGSKADRVLFYPKYWDTVVADARDRDSQLLVMARDTYKVKLQPISLLTVEGRTTATPIALPRAYWSLSKPWPLTSLLMVIQPNLDEFARFKKTITGGGNEALVNAHKFDMELINERFEDNAMVLPHRPYALLSGEFRSHNHSAYLGSTSKDWDAERVYSEAKLVHFSDWPLPKPWIMWPQEGLAEMQPDCGGRHDAAPCAERRIWKHLYDDFRLRRKDICRLLSVPAPDWANIKGGEHSANVTEGTGHEAPHAEGQVEGSGKDDEQTPVHDA